MKIRVTVPIATPGRCYLPGADYEFADHEAESLIAAGQAVRVTVEGIPDAARKPQPQTLDQKPGVTAGTVHSVQAPKPTVTTVAPAVAPKSQPVAAALTPVEAAKKVIK